MQVHDYEGGSLFKMDANVKQALRQIIKLFQASQTALNHTCLTVVYFALSCSVPCPIYVEVETLVRDGQPGICT